MPLSFSRRFLRYFGVDRAIGYSLIGQVWSVLAGPLSVVFLAHFLTPVEQGFYYTFSGVLALLIFLELGLGFVLLQFASHEKAALEWTAGGTLEGDPAAKARLSSLLRRVLFWYAVLAVLSVVLLWPIGVWFFHRQPTPHPEVVWQGPWIAVVLVSAVNLLLTPVLSVLEGCGLIVQISGVRTVQRIAASLVTWGCLYVGLRLYTIVGLNLALVVVACAWVWKEKRVALLDLLAVPSHPARVDWWREVWPLQWRVALSGASSYFIFAFFNPVLFTYHGAVAAGQMGMTMTIVSTLAGGPMSWVGTKIAPFGTLIAKKQWRELDAMFFPAMWQSLAIMAVFESFFLLGVFYLHFIGHKWSIRLIDPLPLALLILATLMSAIVGCEALYLRAHKQEPYVFLSLVGALFVALSTYFLGRPFAALGMTAGYLVVNIGITLAGTWIFITKRREWHQDPPLDLAGEADEATRLIESNSSDTVL